MVSDKVTDLKAGVAMAEASIDGGMANTALAKLIAITNEAPPPGHL